MNSTYSPTITGRLSAIIAAATALSAGCTNGPVPEESIVITLPVNPSLQPGATGISEYSLIRPSTRSDQIVAFQQPCALSSQIASGQAVARLISGDSVVTAAPSNQFQCVDPQLGLDFGLGTPCQINTSVALFFARGDTEQSDGEYTHTIPGVKNLDLTFYYRCD